MKLYPRFCVCLLAACTLFSSCGGDEEKTDVPQPAPVAPPPPRSGPLDFDQLKADEEFSRGVRAFHRGFYTEAVQNFQRALSFKPEAGAIRSWLGRAYYLGGFTDAAIAEWKTVGLSGQGSPILENFVEILESRQGIGVELRGAERWVVSGEIGGKAENELVFSRPVAVRTQADGSFYVVSYMTNEVARIDSNGIVRSRMKGGLAGFNRPFDLAVSGDAFYVSEFQGDKVTKCDSWGNEIAVLGGKGREPGKLLGPQYLALDPEGSLYVSERANRRVSKYNSNGEFTLSFGEPNEFYPGFLFPTGLAFHNGYIYVADASRKHIAVFDASGNYHTTILEGALSAPEGITVLEDGRFLISDTTRLFTDDVENAELRLVSDFGGVAKRVLVADIDANGNILAPDFNTGTVHVLSELAGISSGLTVFIKRINAESYPDIEVDVQVSNRFGRPVVGLDARNFILTENRLRPASVEMNWAAYRSPSVDVAIVMSRAPAMAGQRDLTGRLVRDLTAKIQDISTVRVISAGPTPAVVSRPGDSGEIINAAAVDKQENYRPDWSFDLGIRLGVTEVLGPRGKKAVIFVSDGSLPETAFSSYGLQQTLDYMRNNSIVFYAVYTSAPQGQGELEFLARETGGNVYRYFNSESLNGLRAGLESQADGSYILSYRSAFETDFGRANIPVEVEALLIRRSGRDESGFFAPLQF
jgi:DNA-binding beta-propeller fold protein YncE